MNSQDEMAGNSVSGLNWCGFDELRLTEGAHSVVVTIGSQDKWDKAHLRRLRQSADLPGLVPVIDSDFASDGKPFAVTPAVDSPTLAGRIPPTGSEWEDCAAITEAAARATHEAHLRGLFHGSLSPDLIYVIDNDVAVNGIGLGLGGTPSAEYAHWVAPEVLDGSDATERSDVYSLGKILEASLGSSLENVPRSVRRLIMWSSSDTPEARPPSALEFASILAEALGEDRTTYSPAFIPTSDTNDLASTASGEVASYVPSETSSSSSSAGTAAAVGAAGAGIAGAAVAGSVLGNDDQDDLDADDEIVEDAIEIVDNDQDLDDRDVTDTADIDVETLTVDEVDGIKTDDISIDDLPADDDDSGVLSDAVTTGELSAETAAMAASTAEISDEEIAAAESAADEPVFDSREYSESLRETDTDADYEVPAAAQTIDLDERFEPERKGNKAGILIGAVLALALGVIAYNLLNSSDEDEVASETPAITEDAEADAEAASPSISEDEAVEEEVTTTVTTEVTTTTEAPTTTTEAAPEVEEAAPAATVDGPITKDSAGVQVLHGIPGAEVDVYVDGAALAPGFTLGTIAGPADLAPGSYEVDIYAASDAAPADAANRTDDPLISETLSVGDDPTTVVAHLDGEGNPVISAFTEDFGDLAPATGRVELRHLAAAPGVSATIDGEALPGLLEPGKTATIELAAGEHTIETATADGTPVTSATITLADGELASISVIGVAADDTVDVAVQRFTGLASAPAAVPTGDSNLLGADQDPTVIYILASMTSLMALAGGAIMVRRSRRVL